MSAITENHHKCRSCVVAQEPEAIPFVYRDDLWTVNLRLDAPPRPLLGWSVLQPRRHVNAVHEFTPQEQQTLGPMLAHCDEVMREMLGAERIYVCLFAEDPNFHLHFHLIPRRPDLPNEYIGPGVFGLSEKGFGRADPDEVDQVLSRLRTAFGR